MAQFHGYNEGDGFNNAELMMTKADEAKWQGVLDEDSYYMRGLKFFFEANKMGLLDPDSLTQKFPDVINKYSDGQILFAQFPWLTDGYNTEEHVNEGKGFAFVPFAEEQMSICRIQSLWRQLVLVYWREDQISGARDAIHELDVLAGGRSGEPNRSEGLDVGYPGWQADSDRISVTKRSPTPSICLTNMAAGCSRTE